MGYVYLWMFYLGLMNALSFLFNHIMTAAYFVVMVTYAPRSPLIFPYLIVGFLEGLVFLLSDKCPRYYSVYPDKVERFMCHLRPRLHYIRLRFDRLRKLCRSSSPFTLTQVMRHRTCLINQCKVYTCHLSGELMYM